MSQIPPNSPQDFVYLSVRVTRETADGIKRVADAEYRPVAAEIRRLVEERIAAFDAEELAA